MSSDVMKIIVEAVITICTALITGFLIPWIKSKLTIQQQENLTKVINVAVMAAEQLITPEQYEEKKQYVCDYLSNLGYDVSSEEINNMIEAAVLQIKKIYRSTTQSTAIEENVTEKTAVESTTTETAE